MVGGGKGVVATQVRLVQNLKGSGEERKDFWGKSKGSGKEDDHMYSGTGPSHGHVIDGRGPPR